MHATIILSSKEHYQFPLFKKKQTLTSSIYDLATRFFKGLTKAAITAFSFLNKLIRGNEKNSSFKNKEPCLQDATPTLFQGIHVQSMAIGPINHSYAAAPLEQKQALEAHILKKLEKKHPALTNEQREILAHKIANDSKIYNKEGLCSPYSWLFAAYILKYQDSFNSAKELKDRFAENILTKTAPPLIDFVRSINFNSLVKSEKGAIIVKAQKLHPSLPPREKAIKMMQKLGYCCFKSQQWILSPSLLARYPQIEKKIDESNSTFYLKLLKASSLKEQILDYGKDYDTHAFHLSIPGHAMCFYINAKKRQFIFFDVNLGIINFDSLKTLAKGISRYTKKMYSTNCASYLDIISI